MKSAMLRGFLLSVGVVLGWRIAAQSQVDTALWSIDLDDVVVTAQYAPTATEEAVHEVTVLKATELQRRGFNNLAEALSQQINLRVDADPVLGNGLRINGIGGENIQVMIDGVPVIGRLDGNIDLSQINLSNVAQVEIIQGALSAQYGSNAAGGVINIITRKSQLTPWRAEGQHQWESLDINNSSLSVGRQAGKFWMQVGGMHYRAQFAPQDSLRLYEIVQRESGESFRRKKIPWNPKKQLGADANIRYNFSDSISLRYRFNYFDEEVSIFGEARRPRFQPYAFDDIFTTLRQDHNLHFDARLPNEYYLQSTTAFNRYERLGASLRRDLTTDTVSLVPNQQDTTTFTTFLHRSIFSTNRDRFWNALLGLEYLYETGKGDRIIDESSLPFNETSRSNVAVWAGLRLEPSPGLLIESNLRYGYNSAFDHPLIPSLNIAWTPGKRWTLRGSYAHGFRAPSLKELHFNFVDVNHYIVGNINLDAEYARNANASAIFRPVLTGPHQLSLKANLFYNLITNRIVLAEFERLRFNYQNLDRFETHGLNLQLSYRFGNTFALNTNFALTRLYNTFVDEPAAPQFTTLPEMQNELRYVLPILQADLTLLHRYIGRQVRFYQQEHGELGQGFIGDFHLLQLNLSRNFWQDRLIISAGVKNLLDQSAVEISGGFSGGAHSGNSGEQLIGFGRSFFVRMQLALGW